MMFAKNMVEIIQDSVVPYTQSVVPAIKLTIRETVSYNEILLRLDGIVLSDDNKFVANLIPLTTKPSQVRIDIRSLGDFSSTNQTTYINDMIFILDKKALDYIEEARFANKKRDVVLKFDFNEIRLTHNLKIGLYNKVRFPQFPNQDSIVSVTSPMQADQSDMNLRMLVAEQSNLFVYNFSNSIVSYTIRASDWVNDFQGPLGLGNFLVVEIPQPETLNVPRTTLTQEQQDFADRLQKASEILKSMELELNKGEWGNVVEKSRGLLELLRRDMKGIIKKMIASTTSMDEQKAGSLTESIDKLFGYASDLHHIVDSEGKAKDVYTGGKEDAYLVYSISTSLVNLLTRKFASFVSKASSVSPTTS